MWQAMRRNLPTVHLNLVATRRAHKVRRVTHWTSCWPGNGCILRGDRYIPPLLSRLKTLDLVTGVHQRNLQRRIVLRVGVDGDGGGFVVLGLGGHDVGHEGLRIAIVE